MVGKVAIVPVVLSVAVDVAGGHVAVVAAVRVVVVRVAPRVEAAAEFLVYLPLSVLLLSLLMDHGGFGMTRVRFAVRDQKAVSADRETLRRSFHAV